MPPFTPEQKVEIYTWAKIIWESDPGDFELTFCFTDLLDISYNTIVYEWGWDCFPELRNQFPITNKPIGTVFDLAIERVIRENINGNTNLTK